jgi:AhpD family alkylhydroperoxidase
MNYNEISKETFDLLYQSRASLSESPVAETIRVLAELRTSQINGCAYCCRLHTQEARKAGFPQDKLDVLPAWRSSHLFTEEEKTILEWTESLVYLKEIAEVRKKLLAIYSEKQVVDLTACVSLMSALNRIAIALRD